MNKNISEVKIEGSISFEFSFDSEANSYHIVCPEFQLHSFGETKQIAAQRLQTLISDTFIYLIEEGDLDNYIDKIGCTVVNSAEDISSLIKVVANGKEYTFLPNNIVVSNIIIPAYK